MLDSFFQWLKDGIESLKPFVIVQHFERAVALDFGKHKRVLGPGMHWVWPLGFTSVFHDNVVWRTVTLGVQSLITKDNRHITLRAVITARIEDIEKAMLEVESVDHALIDSCCGAIGMQVAEHTWDEVRAETFSNELAKACRRGAKRYGIEIDRVQLQDLTQSRALRLFQDHKADN